MPSFYNNADFNDYLIGNLYIEAKNKKEACNAKYVKISDSVKFIAYGTFQSCTNLRSITIPNSVTSIGNSAFRFCSSLTSITIPKIFENKLDKILYEVDLSKVSIIYT
jgi:hypothetical protein